MNFSARKIWAPVLWLAVMAATLAVLLWAASQSSMGSKGSPTHPNQFEMLTVGLGLAAFLAFGAELGAIGGAAFGKRLEWVVGGILGWPVVAAIIWLATDGLHRF